MDELKKVNKELSKIKARKVASDWNKNNHEKVKQNRDNWNKLNRKEYQRAYRLKNK